MVRNCVARLERLHGKHNLAFATYTLPELPRDEMDIIRSGWCEVTRQLKQSIERDLEKAGIVPQLVYNSEIQDERFEKTGQIVPHIHVVYQSRKTRYHNYAIDKERNTEIWNRVISNVLGHRIEMPSAARIETIKKSAERYMSKYMSKGCDILKRIIDKTKCADIDQPPEIDPQEVWMPKSWWGATISLRDWVKANTKVLSEDTKQLIRNNFRWFEENLDDSPFKWLYIHYIEQQENGATIKYPVAVVGRVRRDWMQRLACSDLN